MEDIPVVLSGGPYDEYTRELPTSHATNILEFGQHVYLFDHVDPVTRDHIYIYAPNTDGPL